MLSEWIQLISTWQTLAIMLFVGYTARKIISYSRLRHFPGPPGTGLTDILHSRALLSDNCHIWYRDISRKYGPVARVAPNLLMTSSVDLWTHVNLKPGYKRSDWYYQALRFEHRRDNVFTQTDNQKHDERRKQMALGYSGRENLDLEPAIDIRVRELLTLIKTKYLSTPSRVVPLDLAATIQYFTLDVISAVGLGSPFGMLAADSDVSDYIKSTSAGIDGLRLAMALGIGRLGQVPILGRLVSPSPDPEGDGFSKMLAECFRLVSVRELKDGGEFSARSDMLASFMRHGLGGDDLRSEAAEQIVAGSDTTAAGLRAALLLVMTNSRVCRKLQREIDEAVAELGDDDEMLSFAKARRLPYLQAVIREALRLWPPVVNIFSRDVPPGGDEVVIEGGEKVRLPGGACVGYSSYAMHHDEAVYGADADAFRPERWLEEELDPERLALMTRTNDLVFGYGRWQCLGKPVAQIELCKIIFEVFRRFDLATLDPEKPWIARNTVGLFNITNMWVQVHERE